MILLDKIEIESYKAELKEVLKNKSYTVINAEKSRKWLLMLYVVMVLSILASFVYMVKKRIANGEEIANIIIIGCIVLIIGTIIFFVLIDNRLNKITGVIKNEIVSIIIDRVYGDCKYYADKKIEKEDYYGSGIFEEKLNTKYIGNDLVEYGEDENITRVSELNVSYHTGNGKSRRDYNQFKGVYFVNEIENMSGNEMLIKCKEKRTNNIIGKIFVGLFLAGIILMPGLQCNFNILSMIPSIIVVSFVLVLLLIVKNKKRKEKLEITIDERLNREFYVTGNNNFACKVFNHELIEEILKFREDLKIELSMSIRDNKIYTAFHTNVDMFELNFFTGFDKEYLDNYIVLKKCMELNKLICKEVINQLEKGE